MDVEVYLGLGSNEGNPEENLSQAIQYLSAEKEITLIKCSNIYETEPVGYTDQKKFLNMAVLLHTSLEPYQLLNRTKNIENILKRKRSIRWGPRTIDIDILLFGDYIINDDELTIPHKELINRAFALIPLKDIYLKPTINGVNIDDLIARAVDKEGVKFLKAFETSV